jgi:hypothetical protein
MVIERALAAAGDEDHLLDARFARFLDRILDERLVDDRQHLLGHRLGGGEEAGAEAGDREHGLANRFHRFSTVKIGAVRGAEGRSGRPRALPNGGAARRHGRGARSE